MKVDEIMTRAIVTIKMDDSLKLARDIFGRTKFHHLLVVEGKVLYGVLSDRDLLKAVSPNIGTVSETVKDTATLNKKVHQIMTRKPVTLHPQSSVNHVIDVFNSYTVSCVPVVDDECKPVGIVSWRDVLASFDENKVKASNDG